MWSDDSEAGIEIVFVICCALLRFAVEMDASLLLYLGIVRIGILILVLILIRIMGFIGGLMGRAVVYLMVGRYAKCCMHREILLFVVLEELGRGGVEMISDVVMFEGVVSWDKVERMRFSLT